jgi:hypothetical protein
MISTQPQMLLQKSLQHQDIPAGKALSEKAIKVAEFSTIFTDLSQYQKVLGHVELILDEIETELGSEKHLGPWLCGPTFSAADICLVSSVPFKSMVLFRFGMKIIILSATILGGTLLVLSNYVDTNKQGENINFLNPSLQVALLLRLHQIGLDEKFWKHGQRPMISVYQVIFKFLKVNKKLVFTPLK